MADLTEFVPQVWADTVLASLLDVLVAEQICNTDYEGEISQYGDTVKINEIGEIAISTYTPGSTSALTPQTLDDAQKELKIDTAKSFSFWVDDVAKAQAKGMSGIMGEAMRKAANSLAKVIDTALAGLSSVAGIAVTGTSAAGTDVTSTNVLKYISIMAHKLDEANVPQAGRWTFIPPWFHQKMVLANITLNTSNSASLASGSLASNGYAGSFYGFDFYVSNNVTNGTPATDLAAVLCGYTGSISMARQVNSVEAVRPALYFRDLVKGLLLYGIKAVRPNTLGVAYVDYTAESS